MKHLLALVIIFALLQSNASAKESSERINWFFKSKGDNSRPSILEGIELEGLENSLYLGPDGDKTIYLTFDAGYSNENVEKILDILKERSIKAAFFILPGIIKNSPETVLRMTNEGHLVCNHTTSHSDVSKITDIKQFEKELAGVEESYKALTGKEMAKYFRPPEGAFSKKTLEFCGELGYKPVFWSFAYRDWEDDRQPDCEKSKEKILNNAHDGMVMLLHPTSKTNAEILDSVIEGLTAKGFSFGTLDELSEKSGI